MLLEKLARAIACKHCENPSKLYELQIHADEQTREILRLNHVLDEVKKERGMLTSRAKDYKERYEEAVADAKCFYDEIVGMKQRSCENCGNDYCMFRPEGTAQRYNCHLWVPKEEEHEDHA